MNDVTAYLAARSVSARTVAALTEGVNLPQNYPGQPIAAWVVGLSSSSASLEQVDRWVASAPPASLVAQFEQDIRTISARPISLAEEASSLVNRRAGDDLMVSAEMARFAIDLGARMGAHPDITSRRATDLILALRARSGELSTSGLADTAGAEHLVHEHAS